MGSMFNKKEMEAIKIVKDIVLETVEKLDMLSEDISERIKNEKNAESKKIPQLKKEGKDVSGIFEEMKKLSAKIK